MTCVRCGAATDARPCDACGYDATPVLAGWGLRVGATALDFLTMLGPLLIAKALFGQILGGYVYLVVVGAYLIPMWRYNNGQSLGNFLAKTRVVDAQTLATVTTRTAATRYLFFILGYLFEVTAVGLHEYTVAYLCLAYLAVDWLMPLWDERNQTLHDRFAGTLVVKVEGA